MTPLHPALMPCLQGRRLLRASKVLTMVPGRERLHDALILVEDDRIAAIGARSDLSPHLSGPVIDLGETVVAPGLINAHTHLELSHLRDLTVSGQGFEAWVRSLLALPMKDVALEDLGTRIAGLVSGGTAHVADILGHSPDMVRRALDKTPLGRRLFLEFFGFKPLPGANLAWPKGIRPDDQPEIAAAGHALYSTHPTTLQTAKTWSSSRHRPFSIHLAEHQGEVEFLATGRGSFADLIRDRLVPGDFVPPGISPVAYADRLGLLDEHTLAVHCVHVSDQDISILAERGCGVCLCPRSNAHIGVGRAPWELLESRGARISLGTDSLASNADLDLWNEAVYLARHWEHGLSLTRCVALATRNPALALRISGSYGTLAPGMMARFSQVPEALLTECSPT